MKKQLQTVVLQSQLLDRFKKHLIAVSGGVDSIVLLHLLKEMGYDIVAAHCNFHLRGEDSNRDQEYVQSFCKKHSIECTFVDFDTTLYAQDKGISIEMAARELRYEWFEKERIRLHCESIVVGHHADDAIETFFLNIARGSGIKGIQGMPYQNGKVVRPLLKASRSMIEKYASYYALDFCEDITNADTKYKRNHIRHQVVPAFEEMNPHFRQTMLDNLVRFQEAAFLYQEQVDTLLEQMPLETFNSGIIEIDFSKLSKHPAFATLLFERLQKFAFNTSQVQSIHTCIQNQETGRQFYSYTHRLVVDRTHLILTLLEESSEEEFILHASGLIQNKPSIGKFEVIRMAREDLKSFEMDAHIAYFDADLIQFPLRLRHWQQGDVFYPFGMKGKRKKVSDYFVDQKLSLIEKERSWLLVNVQDIVWIVGHRSDHRYAVNKQTKNVLILKYLPQK
jgi:tRNA(Ile)-lysidine synthase